MIIDYFYADGVRKAKISFGSKNNIPQNNI